MPMWKFCRGDWVECDAPAAEDDADSGVDQQAENTVDPQTQQETASKGWVWRRPLPRHWLKIYVHAPLSMLGAPRFDLIPKLIGRKGKNMKNINSATGGTQPKQLKQLSQA